MANGTNKGGKQRHEDKGIRATNCIVCGESVTYRKSKAHPRGGRYCKRHNTTPDAVTYLLTKIKKAVA